MTVTISPYTTVRVHVALIEWDSSETPTLHFGKSWREVALAAIKDVQGYVADDDEEFWEVFTTDVDTLNDEELKALHEQYRGAITVPWITFFTEEVTGLSLQGESE